MKKGNNSVIDTIETPKLVNKKDKRVLVLFVFAILLVIKTLPSFFDQQELRGKNLYFASEDKVFVCPATEKTKCRANLPKKSQNMTSVTQLFENRSIPPKFSFFFNKPFAINKASVTELTLLPGIGPRTAEKIYTYRMQKGSITTIDEMMVIDGIGHKTIERIKPFVDVVQ